VTPLSEAAQGCAQRESLASFDHTTGSTPVLVKRRLGAIVAMYLPQLGEARTAMLKALGNYSEAVMDVVQRQEHAGQKEGQALTWGDGRRVVFHVASVMYEYAITFAEIAPDA
jgi:hypothetical protein